MSTRVFHLPPSYWSDGASAPPDLDPEVNPPPMTCRRCVYRRLAWPTRDPDLYTHCLLFDRDARTRSFQGHVARWSHRHVCAAPDERCDHCVNQEEQR